MDMDLDKYVNEYFHIPRDEMEKIRKGSSDDAWFEAQIRCLHDTRESEKQHGKPALRPQPLAHLLSVILQPNHDKPLAVYGQIYADFFDAYKRPIVHEFYTRGSEVPEILGTNGSLTLNGPDYSCWPDYACLPLFRSRIHVNLFDDTNNIFARTSFGLDDMEDDYEQVKSKVIPCEQGSLTVRYIAIPLGVHCRIEVRICNSKGVEKHDIVNVNGTIVARYADTYGNYSSEECVLFKKQDVEFERVEIGYVKPFPLSRCWVSLPAYSSLIVELDLSEFDTRRKFGNGTIKLLPKQGSMSGGSILLDDLVIKANVAWFSPEPLGRNDYKCSRSSSQIPTKMIEVMETKPGFPTKEVEEMDTEGEEESSDDDGESLSDDESPCDESGDVLSSNRLNRRLWSLRSHKNKPWSSPAVEIFSVFVGREKSKAVQIYGSIEVLYGYIKLCYIFKRAERDALRLSESMNSVPVRDGSRIFDDCSSLQMKFDIKDSEGHFAVKGYVDWAASVLDSSLWYEKQLCSFIQGQHGGFAAVHYSIFSEAVGVNIKVLLRLKTGNFDVYPKVWGSLVTQYSHYDYSSRYNKDYYRIVLFKRTRENLIQLRGDSAIPLSRSAIVVPSYSSLIVNVDLSFGVPDQKLSCSKMIEIGEGLKTAETNDYLLHIELDWCEIK